MPIIIIIAIFILLVVFFTNSKKNRKPAGKTGIKHRAVNRKKKKSKVDSLRDNTSADDSIIDITGQSVALPGPPLRKFPVPYWGHRYVYAYNEINEASKAQVEFYTFFKESFLKGDYIDIDGNTNYAFVLLFDLLTNDFEKHKDPGLLEKQFEALGYYYPKTKSYAVSFLVQKMESLGDWQGVSRVRNKQSNDRSGNDYNFDQDYWGLGTRHKAKLGLTEEQVILLNKVLHASNNFSTIEFCSFEIIKLFLRTSGAMNAQLMAAGSSLENLLGQLAELTTVKYLHHKKGTAIYSYTTDRTVKNLYTLVYKHCENKVRDHYGHKRKINVETGYENSELQQELDTRLLLPVSAAIEQSVANILPPDEATETELYAQNTGRWKIKFEALTANYTGDPKQFFAAMTELAKLNKRNPSVENIFFEASKFMGAYDKETALSLYLYYLHHDLKSATFDNKQLTKTIQKNLFKTNEQLHDFSAIISGMIKDRDLEQALAKVAAVYKTKRKKIELHATFIKEVKEQHSGTVDLLSNYLNDEYEDENSLVISTEINKEEITLEITNKNEIDKLSVYRPGLIFTAIHKETLDVFVKANFSVPMTEIELFAKTKGMFKNQLIESLNDTCFETLDDVLIEEENELYIINPEYYQRLLATC